MSKRFNCTNINYTNEKTLKGEKMTPQEQKLFILKKVSNATTKTTRTIYFNSITEKTYNTREESEQASLEYMEKEFNRLNDTRK